MVQYEEQDVDADDRLETQAARVAGLGEFVVHVSDGEARAAPCHPTFARARAALITESYVPLLFCRIREEPVTWKVDLGSVVFSY